MRRLSFIVLICLLPAAQAEDGQLRGVMQHLADSLLGLMPTIHDREFDREKFLGELDRFSEYVGQAESHFEDQPLNARITYGMLQERVDEVRRLAGNNSLLTARSVLAESFELCASCHTQDRKSRPGFGVSKLRHLDEFQAAEFSFLSRDYSSALTSYKNFLDSNTVDAHRRSLALDRVLAITAQVYGDLDAGIQMLDEIQLATPSEKARVADWRSVFQKLKDDKSSMSPLKPDTLYEMDHYLAEDWPSIQSFMGWHEQQAYWMIIRRQLNAFMEREKGSGDTPVLLYWQAVADRSTHFQFYESLSRQYLERCVRGYPEHEYARKCFDEYELLMIVSFSGSGGIHLPYEIRQEINALRKLAYPLAK